MLDKWFPLKYVDPVIALLVVESFMLWPRAFMSGASMSSSASLSWSAGATRRVA